jgi:hypothetical protein
MKNLRREKGVLRKLAPALFISVTIHLLLIWYLVDKFADYLLHSSHTAPPSPIQITINQRTLSTTAQTDQESPSTQKKMSAPIETPDPQPIVPPRKQSKPSNKDRVSTVEAGEDKVTAKRILTSSKEISRIMASTDQPQHTVEKKDSMSTIFNRAFDNKREAPNISTLADGTTRVVTDWGNTYCIKALDDWKIIDPQDDMRVSVFCN